LDVLLGRGGTADVFKATDLRLGGRPVAVKRFRPDSRGVPQNGFSEEALLLARLRHPHLVTVYDAGQDEDSAYLVMEHIDGTTLRERIGAGPLPFDHVVRLGSRLASALAHVHAAGIVHRDIKPSNVLLDAEGEPFLADFGISRPTGDPTRAEPGTLVGTLVYMAPEQILGKGSGPASDVYALGLVLLECLKGAKEYQGEAPEAGMARLLRPPDTTTGVPEPLVPLLEAMTRSEPAARPDAAHCALLFQAAADAPVRSAPPAPDTTTRPQAAALLPLDTRPADLAPRRRKRRALAAAATAVVLAATGVVLAGAADVGRQTPRTAERRLPATASPTTAPAAAAAIASPRRRTTAPSTPQLASPVEAATVSAPGASATGSTSGPGQGHGKSKGKAKHQHKKKG
jgi:serine/threonine protein kinase